MKVLYLRQNLPSNIIESITKRLLGMYLDSKAEQLILSPRIQKPEGYTQDHYGFALISLGREEIGVPPPNNLVPRIIAYVRKISSMYSVREGSLLVENPHLYRIFFSTSIDEQTKKETITFNKRILERMVGS